MATQIDPELGTLIHELIDANILKRDSRERRLAERVAVHGIASLTAADRSHFERTVLPILAKPIREQLAVASIMRKGGYVPRKVDF